MLLLQSRNTVSSVSDLSQYDNECNQIKSFVRSSFVIPSGFKKNGIFLLGNQIAVSSIHLKPMIDDENLFLDSFHKSAMTITTLESMLSFDPLIKKAVVVTPDKMKYKNDHDYCKSGTALSVADILDHAAIGCEFPWLCDTDRDINKEMFNSCHLNAPFSEMKVVYNLPLDIANVPSKVDHYLNHIPPDVECHFVSSSKRPHQARLASWFYTDPMPVDAISTTHLLLSTELLGADLVSSMFQDQSITTTDASNPCNSFLATDQIMILLPRPRPSLLGDLMAVSFLNPLVAHEKTSVTTYDFFSPTPTPESDRRCSVNSRYYSDVALDVENVVGGRILGGSGLFEAECDVYRFMEPIPQDRSSPFLLWTHVISPPVRQFPPPTSVSSISGVAEIVSLKTLLELGDRCHYIPLPKRRETVPESPLTSVGIFTELARIDKFRSAVPLFCLASSPTLLDVATDELTRSLSVLRKRPSPSTASAAQWIELSLHKVAREKKQVPPPVEAIPKRLISVSSSQGKDLVQDCHMPTTRLPAPPLELPRIHTPVHSNIPVVVEQLQSPVPVAIVVEPDSGNDRSRDGLDRFVDAYLQIQGCAPVRGVVVSQQQVLDETPVTSNVVRVLEQDMVAEKIIDQHDSKNDLRYAGTSLLVSDSLLDSCPELITELSVRNGLKCVDCVLEVPVTIALSSHACVCLLDRAIFLEDSTAVKKFGKLLIDLAYKWTHVWVIVHGVDEPSSLPVYASASPAFLELCSAVGKFPNLVILRESKSVASLARIVFKGLEHTLSTSMSLNVMGLTNDDDDDGVLPADRDDSMRCVTECLHKELFAAQCEFLQLFPTINYRQACELLIGSSLSQLNCADTTTHDDNCMKNFADLASVHVGFEI